MKIIRISQRDFEFLKKMELKHRRDCLACFSVNENREIWVYVTRGWTKPEKRKYVPGQCRIVDQIVEEYLSVRPSGGRILLKRNGLFYRELGVGFDTRFAEVEFESG